MTTFRSYDPLADIAQGFDGDYSIVHKFGAAQVTTSLAPITLSGVYQTPTAATALEVVSSDANDTAAGSGAQEVTLVGLGADWTEVTQTVEMNGASAVAVGTNLTRLYRWYVSRSGTYATQSADSHVGTLTVRVASAGATWSTIGLIGTFGRGQSMIGAYTVPLGKTAYLLSAESSVDSTKTVNLYFFQRASANDVATPFDGAMRVVFQVFGLGANWASNWRSPRGPFVGPCDLGFMGQVGTTTADVEVDFELLLVNS